MKIVYVTAEISPFSQTGGLGDVSWALPKALSNLDHEIIVITPLYKLIPLDLHDIKPVSLSSSLIMNFGENKEEIELFETKLPGSNISVYFVKHPLLYRDGIYVDATGKDFHDSAMRFLLFNKAIFEILKKIKFKCDIIHANDWHSGMIPFYLKNEYNKEEFFKSTRSVFTIHNIGYQGWYNPKDIVKANISEEYLDNDGIFKENQVNLMKTAIKYCDIITTVSEAYSKEIQTKEYGFGLEDLLKSRSQDIFGVVHGIDYDIWNPEIDPYLVSNYSHDNIMGKNECKKEIQQKFDLPIKDNIPIIAIISRLAHQKGLDLVLEIFPDIMKLNIQLIILGTGDPILEQSFIELGKNYPNKASVNILFDNVVSHKIEAGADLFLMPSRYEPCGLNQMYSMIYGTVPIVRRTGGLADTVIDFTEDNKLGSGFVFEEISSNEILATIKRAVRLFEDDQEAWIKLKSKIMQIDFSWERASKSWEKIYKHALNKA